MLFYKRSAAWPASVFYARETIKPYVDDFIEFARQHPELRFLVTRIGCGIAGFKPEEIAPLFAEALEMENVILPEDFAHDRMV